LIQRIFHPIGQGAFYSERHNGFNIVYDCGNWKNSKLADKVVRQAFEKGETIDILFISHFDYDHVNKIRILKDHTNIKKVIMPLLHEEEKTLLLNIYRELNFNILKLIESPKNFFGNKTQIITVNTSSNQDIPVNDNQVPIDINESIGNIDSGTIMKKSFDGYDWIFIPYNHEYKDRHTALINELKSYGFSDEDIERLQTDPKFTLSKIISDVSLSKTKGGKIFKQVYDKLDGKINQNSMFLYSGTNNNFKKWGSTHYISDYTGEKYRWHGDLSSFNYFLLKKDATRVACIYTGDADLNEVKIKEVFKSYWSNVGTIQIAHHGDIKSFDKSVLDDKHYLCPISVGERNTYGHPSSIVIADILSQDSYPILVTENLTTCFIERMSQI